MLFICLLIEYVHGWYVGNSVWCLSVGVWHLIHVMITIMMLPGWCKIISFIQLYTPICGNYPTSGFFHRNANGGGVVSTAWWDVRKSELESAITQHHGSK